MARDGLLATQTPGSDNEDEEHTLEDNTLARRQLSDSEGEAEDQTFAGDTSARGIFSIATAIYKYKNMVTMKKSEVKQRQSGNSKKPPILSPDILEKQNLRALQNNPNCSGKQNLMQLERLQRLHILYEDVILHKCLLSYFLLVTEGDRLKLLNWM